jgi:membrane associated rhomboid family serine protease
MKNSKNREIVLIVVWLFIAAGMYGGITSKPNMRDAGSKVFAAVGGIVSASMVVGFMSRKSW